MYVGQYNGGNGNDSLPAIYPSGIQLGTVQLPLFNFSNWIMLSPIQRCVMSQDKTIDCTLIVEDVHLLLPLQPCYALLLVNHTDQVSSGRDGWDMTCALHAA